jgi:negative regulator of flagellin synthesis FlgM
MVSKIKDTSAQLIQQYQKSELVKNEAEKQIGATLTVVTEKVDLSTKAKEIRQIKQILDQTPDVREEKVLELKNKIDTGRYNVNSDKIAEKIAGESLIDLFA